MADTAASSVVVGIDGSVAAINAAVWAADEALDRDVPLRLVHVINADGSPGVPRDDFRLEVQYGETCLRAASAVVNDLHRPVKVETDILWGSVEAALIEESRDAAVICVGSVGIGCVASELLGSTATTLAVQAHCPVAIIRTPHDKPAVAADWIVVAVDDSPDNDAVIECAMGEARLRRAPVLAVGVWRAGRGAVSFDELKDRVEVWRRRYPDVQIYPVGAWPGIAMFLSHNIATSVQLVVIGTADASRIAEFVGPRGDSVLPHGDTSVLIVR